MLVKKAVRSIMVRTGVGTNELARRIGKIPQTVSDRLNSEKGTNLSVDKLGELVSALGYKVMLIPVDVEAQDGWYEIDDSRTVEKGKE